MYSDMTHEQLIEYARLADQEIVRLTEQNTRLAIDYQDAKSDADHWQGMYDDLVNKQVSEEYRQRMSEQRRMAEWNQWAVAAAQQGANQ